MFNTEKKRPTVNQVYNYLRILFGKSAVDIMDSLEGHKDEYNILVELVANEQDEQILEIFSDFK
jgi:hypothetical protein